MMSASETSGAARMGLPLTQGITEMAVQVSLPAVPEPIVTRAKHCFLDWLGVAVAGSREPAARITRQVVAGPGPAEAVLVGTGTRTGILQAALANGTAGHALDFDDVSTSTGVGHPSVPVFPAILALADRDGAPGSRFLEAYIAGHETEGRVAILVSPGHYQAGWHTTGTAGTFGAAAGCAHLLGLDQGTWQTALGIAGTQAAGLKSMFGTMCKPLHAGKAAQNGLLAALLAQGGFTANPDVLGAAQGFAATQTTTPNPDAAIAGPAEGYALRGVVFKHHAACFGTHSSIEGIRVIRREHEFDSGDVASIELRVPPGHLRMCNIESPSTGLEGKFSLRLTAALAACGSDTSDAGFTDAAVTDPRHVAVRDRVTVTPTDSGARATEVRLTLRDGRVLREAVDVSRPASDEQLGLQWDSLVAKFTSLAGPVLGDSRAGQLIDLVDKLEQADSMRAVTELL
jgi:2-methylcitrate dehydratase PrpD